MILIIPSRSSTCAPIRYKYADIFPNTGYTSSEKGIIGISSITSRINRDFLRSGKREIHTDKSPAYSQQLWQKTPLPILFFELPESPGSFPEKIDKKAGVSRRPDLCYPNTPGTHLL